MNLIKKTENTTTVRQLMSIDPEVVRMKLKSGGTIVYEDNVGVYMSSKEIIVTRYLLSIFESIDGYVPITSDLFITNFYSNGISTSKTINNFLSLAYEHMVNGYIRKNGRTKNMPKVFKLMYKILNNMYNNLVYNNLIYVTDIDIRDFLEVQFDDRLMESMDECKKLKTVDSINHAYDVLDLVLRDEVYSHNKIAEGYIAGIYNPNQIKQMLGPRGFVTEINSQLFKIPVTSSFVLGMSDIYELTVESRAGAKALYVATIAVEVNEYFAREWQLVTSKVDLLEDGDCGSTDYVNWKVRSAEEAGGKSDLINMAGKWYLNEETNQLENIKETDTHLEGKTIKMRSAHKCKLKRSSSVCEVCFGDLSYGVFAHTNLGNFTSTTTSGNVTQNMLSTKHLSSSAKGGSVKVSNIGKQFYTIKNGNNYHFRSSVNLQGRSKYSIIINQDEAPGISGLNNTINPNKINPGRISTIKSFITMVEDSTGKLDLHEIEVKSSNQYGVFSKEFIAYVIKYGSNLDIYDRIIVDMSNWDKKWPVLYTPEMEFNFLELSKSIKSMFKYMEEPEDLDAMLQKLFDLTNSKLNINIALLEVIVYAFSAEDPENGNYRLGRRGDNVKACKIEDNIINRSLGSAYGWEKVYNTIINPKSFYNKVPINDTMDVFISPQETVEAYKNGKILK